MIDMKITENGFLMIGEFRGIQEREWDGKTYRNIIVETRLGYPLTVGIKDKSLYERYKVGQQIALYVGHMSKITKDKTKAYTVYWVFEQMLEKF